MSARSMLAFALAAAIFASASGACSSPATPATCTEIPDGGCPVDNGALVCDDPTCGAVYACSDGKWVFTRACPVHPTDAMPPIDSASLDAASVPDTSFDAPPGAYGGPGCTDLQLPDCSVGTALACAGSAGCCGCEDLWVCQSGGWTHWGTCGDGGLTKN